MVLRFILLFSIIPITRALEPITSIPALEKLFTQSATPQVLEKNTQFEAIKRAAERGEQDFIPYIPDFKGISQFNIPAIQADSIEENFDVDAKDVDGRTPLMNAVLAHDTDLFKSLIDRDADPNQTDQEGQAVITYVILYGDTAMLKYLFKYSIILLNLIDKAGMTPLMHAVEKQQPAVIRFLIKKGADSTIQDAEGNTALHRAVAKNNKELVKSLLVSGANPSIQNYAKLFPLDIAQKIENKEIITELNNAISEYNSAQNYLAFIKALKNDAHKELENLLALLKPEDINKKDAHSKTYLLYAVMAHNKCIVEKLLEREADPHSADNEGKTSFNYAHNNPEILKLLELKKNNYTPRELELAAALAEATIHSDLPKIQEHLEAGAPVNLRLTGHEYPLVYTIINENVAAAQLLVAAGAYPNIKVGTFQRSALAVAAAHHTDNSVLARLLIDAGADINAQDAEGSTPLIIAIDRSNVNVAHELIKAKADPNITTYQGDTPLFYAIYRGQPKLVKKLLKLGVSLFHGSSGKTALMYAHEQHNQEVIDILSSYIFLKKIDLSHSSILESKSSCSS